MQIKQLRNNTTLKADGKELLFTDGFCNVKKITKNIQSLIDSGYIKLEEVRDGKATNE